MEQSNIDRRQFMRTAAALGIAGAAASALDIVNVQLVHHLLTVFLDCLDADAEFGCDLFVGLALRDELQDLGFTSGEA